MNQVIAVAWSSDSNWAFRLAGLLERAVVAADMTLFRTPPCSRRTGREGVMPWSPTPAWDGPRRPST
jgi:hypothetical protein